MLVNESPFFPFYTVLSMIFSVILNNKQVKISDKKEQRFGDIVTPFSSSNAKR